MVANAPAAFTPVSVITMPANHNLPQCARWGGFVALGIGGLTWDIGRNTHNWLGWGMCLALTFAAGVGYRLLRNLHPHHEFPLRDKDDS